MEATINKVVGEIKCESIRLQQVAHSMISAINVKTTSSVSVQEANAGKKPPISTILYGASVVSAIVALAGDKKLPWLIAAGACAYGGYKLGHKVPQSTIQNGQKGSVEDISSIKTKTMSTLIDIKKQVSKEWESFMEQKQVEVKSAITSSNLSEQEKSEWLSRIFVYDVLDISMSDINRNMGQAISIDDVMRNIKEFETTITKALRTAEQSQIARYMC